MTNFQWRWLLYAVLISVPALIAWEDFFVIVFFGETEQSLLQAGSTSSYLLFGAALALPLLCVAAARLRSVYGRTSRQARVINLLYLFSAIGYILDCLVFAAKDPNGSVVYIWAIFLMMIYLPVVTCAAALLTPPARPRTEASLS